MAVLAGALAASPLGGAAHAGISANLSTYAVDYWPAHASAVPTLGAGQLVRQFPVASATRNLAGSLAGAYSDDFYHRIYVMGGPVSAGNITSAQDYTRVVWNAYLVPQQLQAVSSPQGVSVSPGPRMFAGIEEATYTIHLAAEGPARIAGAVSFDWAGGGTVTSQPIPLSGSRVLSWSWLPDWSSSIIERLEWKTDVLPLADGSEQRIDLRLGARRVYEFTVAADGMARRYLEAALWDAGAKVWAMPLWHSTRHLTAALPAGSAAVAVPTAHSEFLAGTSAVLLGEDPRRSESVMVAGVTGTHVLLAGVTTMAWPAGSRIVPTRPARIDGAVQFDRFTGGAIRPMRLRFELEEPWDFEPDPSPPLHRGVPVLELRPEWTRGPTLELARDLEQLDALVGGWTTFDRTGRPVATQTAAWTFTTPAETWAFRRFLAQQRGRLRDVWVPSWAQDFDLLASVSTASTAMVVAWAGYSLLLAGKVGRRDLRIELRDGTVAYARVTGAVELTPDTEQVTLDAPLGINATPSQVACISFMTLCRLNADAAEIAHWTADVAQASATFRSFNNDL